MHNRIHVMHGVCVVGLWPSVFDHIIISWKWWKNDWYQIYRKEQKWKPPMDRLCLWLIGYWLVGNHQESNRIKAASTPYWSFYVHLPYIYNKTKQLKPHSHWLYYFFPVSFYSHLFCFCPIVYSLASLVYANQTKN